VTPSVGADLIEGQRSSVACPLALVFTFCSTLVQSSCTTRTKLNVVTSFEPVSDADRTTSNRQRTGQLDAAPLTTGVPPSAPLAVAPSGSPIRKRTSTAIK
jgi:hypothetical protein